VTGLRPPLVVTQSDDYRVVISVGRIASLEPGDAVEVAFAVVVGAGFAGLVENAARAVLLYGNDWRPAGPVAVTVQDMAASAQADGVHLSWRLAGAGEVRRVHVERATTAAGPWAALAALAPAPVMAFVDQEMAPGLAWYRLVFEDADGGLAPQRALAVRIADGSLERLVLHAPFERADGAVEVSWAIPRAGAVDLGVFDVRGRRVGEVARGPVAAGAYARVWDACGPAGARLGRGVYFLRLECGGATAVRRLVRRGRHGVIAY
jgi:hypothetical protein